MTAQTEIPIAASVLGTIGTVCWCVQLLPQIWQSWKTKSTDGVPAMMLLLWAAAGVPMGIYAIVQNFNIPLQIQPQVLTGLSTVCFVQKYLYSYKWPVSKSTLLGVATAVVFGVIELFFVLLLKEPGLSEVEWPLAIMGILGAVFLAVGLLLPYYEMWKRGGRVVDINFIFIAVDMGGALFSLLAIAAQSHFDVLGGVSYMICLLLEVGILLSHGIWRFRTRIDHKEAKQAGKSYDEYIAERDFAASHNNASMVSMATVEISDIEKSLEDLQRKMGDLESQISRNAPASDVA